jgi:hypothetical protein
MITHFFENYILSNNLISIEQLVEVMELQKTTRIKLGLLAISAGYMTALQVNEVNNIQKKVDKRFGDIAIENGYLTTDQVDALVSSQIKPYLLLGQALIDKGYITNIAFEKAVASYKRENEISDAEFNGAQNDKIKLVIADFYNFVDIKNSDIYVEYVSFLFKDIIRFIGDDFTPLKPRIINDFKYDCLVYQNIEGQMNVYSAIEAETDVFVEFASRYSKERLVKNDEYTHSAVGEFLNINNGLFCSNIINTKRAIVELTPQILDNKGIVNGLEMAFLIPVYFTFGVVNFILSAKELTAY